MLNKLTLGIAVIALAACAGTVMAGDYHSGDTLICADCHTMHYSYQHDFAGGAAPDLGAGGPHAYLLRAEGSELCLLCHDGKTFAPDVKGGHANGYVRQAGALTTGASPNEDWKGHSLGSIAAPPGNDGGYEAGASLECNDCHHQHGYDGGLGSYLNAYPEGYENGQYRNLANHPGGSSTNTPMMYAIGTNDLALDIFERDASIGDLPAHYAVANVDFNEPDETASAYATWCKSCHTDFHGAKGGAEIGGDAEGHHWLRHPTNDVNIGGQPSHGHSSIGEWAAAGKANWVKAMDPTGLWDYSSATSEAPGAYTPSCFTCHKAHGSGNSFGLTWDYASNMDGCQQCHNK